MHHRAVRVGRATPSELKQPAYAYPFTPVNLKAINAFVLPGGPMFVHRGMFEAAAAEGSALVAKAIPVLTSFVSKSGGANVSSLLAGALK